jgi:hypothetical protein
MEEGDRECRDYGLPGGEGGALKRKTPKQEDQKRETSAKHMIDEIFGY